MNIEQDMLMYNRFKPFKDMRTVFILLAIITSLGAVIVYTIAGSNGMYYNCNTDDVIQYYPIMNGFIESLKNGTISMFSKSTFFGTSIFANAYYVPLDIFTLITLILSYIMKTSFAYSLVNLFKLVFGTLLFFEVLRRNKLKCETVFFVSLIYYVSGISQTEIVFPVYLSIVFYAPLGMLVVDEYKKNNRWYFVVLYALVLVLYDFYISYMLLAFTCIYFVTKSFIDNGLSFKIKNISLFCLKTFGLVMFLLLGVAMGALIALPAVNYIIVETDRASSTYNLWYYATSTGKVSFQHYINIILNMFSPTNPNSLLIGPQASKTGTSYIKEHMSYYITIGGFSFLSMLFFIRDKKATRYGIVTTISLLLTIFPIVSMILVANKTPYVRWFFMVDIFMLLGISYAMDKAKYENRLSFAHSVFNLIFLLLILSLFFYVSIFNNQLYFVYHSSKEVFRNGMNYTIIIVCLYIFILPMFDLVLYYIRKINPENKKQEKIKRVSNKVYSLRKHFVMMLLIIEVVGAGIFMYSNAPGLSDMSERYLYNLKLFDKDLRNSSDFNSSTSYRVYYDGARSITLLSQYYPEYNSPTMFHSFYDVDCDEYMKKVYGQNDSWSKANIQVYSLYASSLLGIKYFMFDENKFHTDMSNYHNLIYTSDYIKIYEIDCYPFTIYDKYVTDLTSSYITYKEQILLRYAFLDKGFAQTNLSFDETKLHEIINPVSRTTYISSVLEETKDGRYYKFDISDKASEMHGKMVSFFANNNSMNNDRNENYYIVDSENNIHYLCKTTAYVDGYTPQFLYVKVKDDSILYPTMNYEINDYDIYLDYLNEQSQYKNQSLIFKNSALYLNVDMDEKDRERIIMIPYTYSNDWVVNDLEYKLCSINGGFLGVIVPKGKTNVNLKISFVPNGINAGFKISLISTTLFILLIFVEICYKSNRIYNKKRKDNENGI